MGDPRSDHKDNMRGTGGGYMTKAIEQGGARSDKEPPHSCGGCGSVAHGRCRRRLLMDIPSARRQECRRSLPPSPLLDLVVMHPAAATYHSCEATRNHAAAAV